jgi:hypothetical protein
VSGTSLARNLYTLDGEFGPFREAVADRLSPTALDWLIDELNLTAVIAARLRCRCRGTCRVYRAGGGRDAAARRTRGRGLSRGPDPVRLPRCRRSDPRCRWLMPPSTPPGRWACCADPHQLELLTELRRTVRSPGRIALLAFVARQSVSDEQPEGTHFPSVDRLPRSTMPVSGSTHGEAPPTCRPLRRTGLAASTRSPTPWPSGTARR